jgi:uncharacterized membrane protein
VNGIEYLGVLLGIASLILGVWTIWHYWRD